MGQHFELADAETLARIERKLDLLNARMDRNTLIPAPEWCSITEAAKRLGVMLTGPWRASQNHRKGRAPWSGYNGRGSG